MSQQPSLFDLPPPPRTSPRARLPEGLRYQADLVTREEEQVLVDHVTALPFKPFEFHGYTGRRRVVSFGWRYDFSRRVLEVAEPIPDFLTSLREKVAVFAGCDPGAFQQALVLEYAAGAGIGWHRDRSQFGQIAGVSLMSACPFRLRREAERGWDRATLTLDPGSAYLLTGDARDNWEHSIAPVDTLRYSITFRTFR